MYLQALCEARQCKGMVPTVIASAKIINLGRPNVSQPTSGMDANPTTYLATISPTSPASEKITPIRPNVPLNPDRRLPNTIPANITKTIPIVSSHKAIDHAQIHSILITSTGR